MAGEVKRRYNSQRRREQAEATSLEVLEGARRLFERDGYAATSMAAVAEEAGVSLKTVYNAFETKSGLLRALWHRLLRGEHDDVPVGEQDWFRAVLEEPRPERRLLLNARNSRVVKQRAAALMEVIRAAAPSDQDIGELWARIQSEFHANQREVVAPLASAGALRPGLDEASAADVLWALNQPSLYDHLTRERGWTPDRYETWLGDLFCAELLGRRPRRRS